jgi:hypothetical protein
LVLSYLLHERVRCHGLNMKKKINNPTTQLSTSDYS